MSAPAKLLATIAGTAYMAAVLVGLIADPSHPVTVTLVIVPSFIMAAVLLTLGVLERAEQ